MTSQETSSDQKEPVPPRVVGSPVVTFYSFKGGVGRSMALANLAVLAARDFGLNVVIVDWDLEAPGLHRFFGVQDRDIRDGVVDYLTRYKRLLSEPGQPVTREALSVEPSLVTVRTFGSGDSQTTIRLLPAGAQGEGSDYAAKVRAIDWENFYRDWNGAQFIESLRQQLKALCHLVLIDSRTGFTDIGGICTMHLPDVVVLVFAFNDQNLSGTVRVARELSEDNEIFKTLQRKPELLFLPSRKETNELERLRQWERESAQKLAPYDHSPRVKRTFATTLEYIQTSAVPYIPYFAYGEELAAESEGGTGFELVKSYQPLVRLLVGRDPLRNTAGVRATSPTSLRSDANAGLLALIENSDLSDQQRSVVRSSWLARLTELESTAASDRFVHRLLTVGATAMATVVSLLLMLVGPSSPLDYGDIRNLALLLSALVAGAVLLEQNLRPGERWRKATRLATSLKREGQQFLQLSGPYFHAGTHDEAYKLFLARLDRIKEQAERPSSGRVWRDFDLRKLSLNEVQEEYLKLRWKGQLDVMRRRAARLRVGRRLVASASVISTAAVPVVLGLESVGAVPFERWVIISTSLVATLVLAIRDVLQPTAELEDMERRSELLETEGWRFFQLTGPYGVYRDREAAFVEFSERIEGILHADPAGTFLADVVTDADGR